PMSMVMMAITLAKMGRSMKNFENMAHLPRQRAAAALLGRLCSPRKRLIAGAPGQCLHRLRCFLRRHFGTGPGALQALDNHAFAGLEALVDDDEALLGATERDGTVGNA